MYEPEPASLLVSHAPPQSPSFSCFLRSAAFTTWISGITAMKMAEGLVSVNCTVYLSTALVAPGATIVARSDAAPFFSARMRSMLYTTSSAVISAPSWNLAPRRSLNVYVRPSGEIVWLSASHGLSTGGLSSQR